MLGATPVNTCRPGTCFAIDLMVVLFLENMLGSMAIMHFQKG